MSHTIGSFLFDYLYKQGVRTAFGIPGDFALPTFRWLEASEIDLITMTHEPSVGFAADGYARVHGLGVACVTYCVGGLNLLNAVACAYAEKSPLLVISGGPSGNDRKADSLIHHKVRSFDSQRRIFEEVTCASAVLLDPETAADEIIRVIAAVREHSRPGYIEIPYDIVDMPIKEPTLRNIPAPESDHENLEAAIAEAIAAIASAKQPVIVADVELARHGLTDIAVSIAEKFNIPIASTLLSKSIISENNPLYLGVYAGGLSEPVAQEYVEGSDCLILLGAFMSDMFLGLYTAKLDRRKTIFATTEKLRIGLHSYENVLLKDFLTSLATSSIAPKALENPYKLQPLVPMTDEERAQPLDAEGFFRILGLTIAEDASVICDTGDSLLGAIGLRTSQRNNFLSDAYYLSMGFSVPATIGAIAAKPDSRAYCIVGDGAFQMTGMELSTAAKYGMHPIVCILNNDGYGTQRHIIDGPFNNIHRWEYTKIRDVLNYGKAVRVDTKGALEAVLLEAAKTDEMYIIEAIIPKGDCSRSLRRMGEKLGELRNKDKRND
ncbi:MAG: alpha-keto acid decarboxylase family protein [Alphaproteobacteria bacterium]|nr:alpha-keto acid decarboxylase family protein [Alphaproteobacteria bacterium]